MRVVAASALVAMTLPSLRGGLPAVETALAGFAIAAALFLLIGFWTPIVGAVVAILGFWRAALDTGDPWAGVLLGTFGAALALLGPGGWSVDARLFGWKRIDLPERKSRPAR